MKVTLTIQEDLQINSGCHAVSTSSTIKDTEGAPFPSPALLAACEVALSASGMGHPRFTLTLDDGYLGELVELFDAIEALAQKKGGKE